MRRQTSRNSTRRRFLNHSTIGLFGGAAYGTSRADDLSPVTSPRATDGDDRHETADLVVCEVQP